MDGVHYGITAGVSLLPMPQVEQYFQEKTSDFRRIELGFAAAEAQKDVCMKMIGTEEALKLLEGCLEELPVFDGTGKCKF